MASNVNNPHGLSFLRRVGGGPEELRLFNKLASYGTAIFISDVVIQVAGDTVSGAILNAWASATPGTTNPSGVSTTFGAASTLTSHFVNIDYLSIFEAQDNGAGAVGFALANNGLNANVTTDAGSTTTKLSGQQLDSASFNTSASRDVHLLGLYGGDPTATNQNPNAYGVNARVEVMFNHHRMGLGVAGV